MNPVLAHMGGVDEIGVFLVPALLAIYAFRRAERQARTRAPAAADGDGAAAPDDVNSSVTDDDSSGTEPVPPV